MPLFFPQRSSEPEARDFFVKFVGGTAAVTKVFGQTVTVTYISTGIVDLVWGTNPGTFLGFLATFQATTASGVKGYTVVPGAYNATTFTLRLNITDASETLADLAAAQWLNCLVKFKATSA